MPSDNFTVRTMNRSELDIALQWAEREGWNPGLHDAQCFYAADPKGFFIGLLDDLPVACVSAVRYGPEFGFMGLYIVEPEYRHSGYGMQLAQAGLHHLAGCTVGLDGVVEQQENYRKSGFQMAYRNIRYRGASEVVRLHQQSGRGRVVPLSQVRFGDVVAYDRNQFPAERGAFLAAWLQQPGAESLGLINDGSLQGYGVIRPCSDGYKIGPLFAGNSDQAEQLFQSLSGAVPAGANIYLDIPEPNVAAIDLVHDHGMEMVFETARMYLGSEPQIPIDNIFGVTTFELG